MSITAAVANLSRYRAPTSSYKTGTRSLPTYGTGTTSGGTTRSPAAPTVFNPTTSGSSPGPTPGINVGALPPDATYEDTASSIDAGLAGAQAEDNNRIDRAKKDYGYDDPSNPYNRAALLQQSFQNAQRGAGNSAAAAGQLYAGSLVNTRNTNQDNFNKADAKQRQEYSDLLNQLIRDRDVTLPSRANDKKLTARNDMVMRQLAEHQNDPAPTFAQTGNPGDLTPEERAVVTAAMNPTYGGVPIRGDGESDDSYRQRLAAAGVRPGDFWYPKGL